MNFTASMFEGCRSPLGCVAAMWLHHDRLDEAHTIAQSLETPEGSFWHAIMHRREPDAANARYWYRRVGKHPVFPKLRGAADALGGTFRVGAEWDPFAWVDFWESARLRPGSPDHALALEIQHIEWQTLFDYCSEKP